MTTENTVPLDKLAACRRKIKAKIQEIDKDAENKKKSLQDKLTLLDQGIKDQMLALGVKSVKTEQGTIILSEKTTYATNDWAEMDKFVVENAVPSLLQRRISQTNIKQYLLENPDNIPAGLYSNTNYQVSVRKPT